MTYSNLTGYPSVTTIIRPYLDTSWFTAGSPERGSAVHAACAAHLQGLFTPPLSTEYRPYFDSFKRWADARIDKILLIETRLVDPALKYCGQSDLICTLRGEPGEVLIDFKTSQAIHPAVAIQIAAYRHLAAKQQEAIVTHRGIALRLKDDGSGCLVTEYPRDYRQHFNIFVGLLNSYHYFKGGNHAN